MRIGVIGVDGVTDRWGTRAHLPAVRALEEAELIAGTELKRNRSGERLNE